MDSQNNHILRLTISKIAAAEEAQGAVYHQLLAHLDEREAWFEIQKEKLRRVFSVWRVFRLDDIPPLLTWRLVTSIGNGPVSRRDGIATSVSPREYESASGRFGAGTSQLRYINLTAATEVQGSVESYVRYREGHLNELLSHCWKGLDRNIREDHYVEILQSLESNRDRLLDSLIDQPRARNECEVFLSDQGVDTETFLSGRLRDNIHSTGVAALRVTFQPGLSIGELYLRYSLGRAWAHNFTHVEQLISTMQSL